MKKQALLLPAAVHCACARPDSRPAQCSRQSRNAASADAAIAEVALEAFAMLFGDGNPPARARRMPRGRYAELAATSTVEQAEVAAIELVRLRFEIDLAATAPSASRAREPDAKASTRCAPIAVFSQALREAVPRAMRCSALTAAGACATANKHGA